MWDKILPAIFGIVGTIVGASINGWITYRMAAQRERVERERENLKHAAEIQQAARLIEMDFLRVQGTVQRCIEDHRWMYRDWPAFTLEGWQKYRDIIALELSHDDWLAVSMAVEAVDNLKTVRDIFYRACDASIAESPDPAALKASVDSYRFDDSTVQTLIPKLNDIIAGRRALAPFVSGQSM